MSYQRIEHIAAGQLKADKAQNIVYQAYLGTCLGVALFDREAGIGGLIHILLPEPPGFANPDFQEKYASTGIPLLINQLTKLGAKREHLKASIAGGALVGPVSRQDINLDIGGRSLDIAQTILRANGISIIKSETGGFFTCTLELDMNNGDTVIKPAWDDTLQTGAPIPKPASKDILNTIQELKPIPQTALKIFRMFHSGQNNFAQITEELSKDQVLSGQTLKLCNSALFSGRIKIDTLKDAVLLLGEEMLIKSVITAAVNNYYHQAGSSGYSLCKGGLFFHAVGVAATAEKIAEKCKSEHTKSAYTTGLLHDIGKVVLDQFVADRSPLLFRKLAQEDIDFIQAEKKILGISHTEVGALLAKEWKFSEGLSEVILLHHNPENAVKRKELAYIIYLADLLIEKFHAGFDLEKMQSHSFKDALDCIGLTLEDLPGLIDTIPINAINTMDNLNS
jgi:putative nucleotidyltransferase with HDIG domain